jgi:hypothetical protein
MHRAGRRRAVRSASLFVDSQRIHVGPERDRPVAVPLAQSSDHPGATNALDDLVQPELAQLRSDKSGSSALLESELRMGVKISPPLRHFVDQGVLVQGHQKCSHSRFAGRLTYGGSESICGPN